MSKLTFECDYNVTRLEELKKVDYPDSDKIPMTSEDIKNLKVGSACYIISRSYSAPRLMMFLGFNNVYDEFRFCGINGVHFYKSKNACKTYNVFRTI